MCKTVDGRGSMPYYNYDEFRKACGEDMQNVIWINPVPKDAKELFNLKNKQELLLFIYNDGLESLSFKNTKPWENNPRKDKPVFVDAYEFRSLGKLGYLAFFYNEAGKWIIKSFHLSENRNLSMEIAIKKALLGITEKDR
ncbi:MAG: hypothetical protein OEV64_09195 [Desulfobulbaceae bacterium]|nr:hypothetical protein [Desulfobulbaceae bacterium]